MSEVTRLLATDDVFREVAELLYGGGGDELVAKMSPTQSDLATHDKKKRAVTAGLSAVGATAGAAGLGLAAKETYHGVKNAPKGLKLGGKLVHAAKTKKLATALIPLEVAGLGGELMATKILHGDAKKPIKKPIKKDLDEVVSQASVPSKHTLTRAMLRSKNQRKAIETTKKAGGLLRRLPTGATGSADVTKADVTWEGEFAKVDDEKQQVFGWASVIEVNGEPVVDLQGDYISPDEMEKAAYSYVQKSRKGGDMHLRDGLQPIQKSEMIESFIVTPEKRDAMGLPDTVPTGWWVGFQVQDPDQWEMIKDGRRTGFSIHGHGRRSPAGV
jgi:Putative phage serine protease XkdF